MVGLKGFNRWKEGEKDFFFFEESQIYTQKIDQHKGSFILPFINMKI